MNQSCAMLSKNLGLINCLLRHAEVLPASCRVLLSRRLHSGIHIYQENKLTRFKQLSFLLKHRSQSSIGIAVVKWQSTVTNNIPDKVSAVDVESVLGKIPEPPVPLPAATPEIPGNTTGELVQNLAEPTFSSIGLGGWSPVGLIQSGMEYLHIGLDIPWWTSIVIGTVIVRVLIFPLVIVAQRNGAKMNNYLPQLQVLQIKMTEARQSGNALDAARYGSEIAEFMKEKGLNPLKNMLVPLAQAPLFISFFMALRGMANAPVESLMHGGLFWFTDLTVPDQYYLLPLITSATLWITIEVGTDSARLSANNMSMMKYFLRAIPVVILPFTVNFPGAILCYWVSTNFISLLQVGFLRIPAVRNYFNIEPLVNFKPDALPIKQKGFVKGMKESWANMKISRELEERHRFDEMQFQKAGTDPVKKTFKYNPTIARETNQAHMSAKKQ